MLLAISRVLGAPVMSLQTGQPLCRLVEPIINPYNLRVVAFYVDGPRLDFSPAVVFTEDIREFGRMGAIVDSSDSIMSPEGMVRLNEIISYNFTLNRLPVIDEKRNKLGRVNGYIIDTLNFEIEQLQIHPGLLKSFATAELLVHRRQIVRVEPNRITVKAPTVQQRQHSTSATIHRTLNPEFDNPFRSHKPVTNQDIRR